MKIEIITQRMVLSPTGLNMYVTPAEKKLMAQIAKNHDKNIGISEKEQKLRDAMVKKYYSKLESVEIDETYG